MGVMAQRLVGSDWLAVARVGLWHGEEAAQERQRSQTAGSNAAQRIRPAAVNAVLSMTSKWCACDLCKLVATCMKAIMG